MAGNKPHIDHVEVELLRYITVELCGLSSLTGRQ